MKTAKPIIILDMDDVLVPWNEEVYKLFGLTIKDLDKIPGRPLERDICKYLSILLNREIGPEELKDVVDRTENFWYKLPPYDYARDLVQKVKVFGEIVIASCIHDFSPDAARQKLAWMGFHLWDLVPRQNRIITSCRHFLAQPNRILIDDSEKNCSDFVLYGGEAVLVPKPWNSLFDYYDPPYKIGDSLDVVEFICDELLGIGQSAAAERNENPYDQPASTIGKRNEQDLSDPHKLQERGRETMLGQPDTQGERVISSEPVAGGPS